MLVCIGSDESDPYTCRGAIYGALCASARPNAEASEVAFQTWAHCKTRA